MGWLDRAKVLLGILDEEDLEDEDYEPRAEHTKRTDRPSLDGINPPSQHTLDDALRAREEGDLAGMRRLLADMDRGRGLRVVLHAAALLEAAEYDELKPLLDKVRREEQGWRLVLQTAAALDDVGESERLVALAETRDAPRWARAWAAAVSSDAQRKRHGLVDLLFADPALARTVATRDLGIEGARDDSSAAQRYAAFAHGRDSIRRFGAELVAQLLNRCQDG